MESLRRFGIMNKSTSLKVILFFFVVLFWLTSIIVNGYSASWSRIPCPTTDPHGVNVLRDVYVVNSNIRKIMRMVFTIFTIRTDCF